MFGVAVSQLALSALLACGLLRHSGKYAGLPAGFFGLGDLSASGLHGAYPAQIGIEVLRYYAPGEWGKLLGLDPLRKCGPCG